MDTQLFLAINDVQDEDGTTTLTHYQNLDDIYIKEEPLETTSEDFEFYEYVLQSIKTEEFTEEEIDVVSVDEIQLTTNHNYTVVPTNPPIRTRQKLKRAASSINNKRDFAVQPTGGTKTRLPLRNKNKKKRSGGGDSRRGVKLARYRFVETKYGERRNHHNDTERQRRVDMRNAFENLRLVVPEVSYKERVAKVMILREAASFCNRISAKSVQYQKQLAELRWQQERLRERVSQLRKMLADKR